MLKFLKNTHVKARQKKSFICRTLFIVMLACLLNMPIGFSTKQGQDLGLLEGLWLKSSLAQTYPFSSESGVGNILNKYYGDFTYIEKGSPIIGNIGMSESESGGLYSLIINMPVLKEMSSISSDGCINSATQQGNNITNKIQVATLNAEQAVTLLESQAPSINNKKTCVGFDGSASEGVGNIISNITIRIESLGSKTDGGNNQTMDENPNSIVNSANSANSVNMNTKENYSVGITFGSSYLPESKNPWRISLTPYGSNTNYHSNDASGYNFGVTGLLNYAFNDQFSMGFHFDLGKANDKSDLFDMDTDSVNSAFGLHAIYRFLPELYTRASLTAIWSQHDRDYQTGGFVGSTDYNGSAFLADLGLGYVYKINDKNSITPEISLSYVYIHTSSYDMNFKDFPLYDMSFDSVSFDTLYGNISLRWDGKYNINEKVLFTPSIKLGIRQNLTNNKIESSMNFLETDFNSRSAIDQTTGIVNAGLGLKSGNFSVNAEYFGDFGKSQNTHGGRLVFSFDF